MIKTQIVKEGNRPVAVILDYQEYKRPKEIEEDKSDYYSAAQVKKKNKKWKSNDELKKELGLDLDKPVSNASNEIRIQRCDNPRRNYSTTLTVGGVHRITHQSYRTFRGNPLGG